MIKSFIRPLVLLIACSGLFAAGSLLAAKERHLPLTRYHPATQEAPLKYRVFCVNGKIEIDTRDLNAMKAARGDQVCQLDSFETLSEARKGSKSRGGVGAECSCRR